ncbi:MAG: UDP-glucose 4-epimerase GalE [Bacteroidetes bacterium]|nr:UDP-glucose 4-epimerase GalE [Bacteroidota bacterium]
MKILVTGGTGFIGSHTVVELQQKGYEVVIIDNLSTSVKEVLYSIEKITGILPEFHEFDLCNEYLTAKFFDNNKDIKGVIHFAAHKAVGESVEKPLKYYRNNLFSLINIMQCMNEHQIKNLVFSSSCTVYGQATELPVTEKTSIQKAFSPYGHTKQISEEIIECSVKSSGIKATLLRYFNPIGAHETALIGELPIGVPNNLVPFITQTAIGKRENLNVFGNDYNTPDGTCIRDYIHVVDLAKAHIIAFERMFNNLSKSDCEIFNIGTGKGYTVLEAIRSFEKVSGKKLNFKFAKRRQGDIEKVWADTTYANNELGWKAEKDIDDMMLSAWKWEVELSNKVKIRHKA